MQAENPASVFTVGYASTTDSDITLTRLSGASAGQVAMPLSLLRPSTMIMGTYVPNSGHNYP
jgi:hypothetical protein